MALKPAMAAEGILLWVVEAAHNCIRVHRDKPAGAVGRVPSNRIMLGDETWEAEIC